MSDGEREQEDPVRSGRLLGDGERVLEDELPMVRLHEIVCTFSVMLTLGRSPDGLLPLERPPLLVAAAATARLPTLGLPKLARGASESESRLGLPESFNGLPRLGSRMPATAGEDGLLVSVLRCGAVAAALPAARTMFGSTKLVLGRLIGRSVTSSLRDGLLGSSQVPCVTGRSRRIPGVAPRPTVPWMRCFSAVFALVWASAIRSTEARDFFMAHSARPAK